MNFPGFAVASGAARVATAGAIEVILRRGDATQRVCGKRPRDSASLSCAKQRLSEEVLDLDRLATDSEMSPIIKLVDLIIYNAMESRASDIHCRDSDTEVQVQVSDRRRALRQGRSHRSRLSPDTDFAYQSYVRVGYCRTPGSAGWPLPRAL